MRLSTMISTTSILLFSFLIFLRFHMCLCFEGCIESERDALLQFRNGLIDPSNRLADWVVKGSDCCRWTGIVCHNETAHVIELHLRTLSQEEYFGTGQWYYSIEEYKEYYLKSALSGKVSPSLLQLKHLSYLDLSYNDFRGVPIPKFIGSIQSLRYLNLSNARFGGTIPPQLGNLSNLHYLNLQSKYYLYAENLDWVSGLSALEFLDLSTIDLGQSFDWLKMVNSIPSLVELHLSGCVLQDFNILPNHNFSSLLVLDLSFNGFEGPIPNGLQNMTLLRELDLTWNYLNSSIPNWLYGLTHLQLLNLPHNEFRGQISSGIGNLTSLVQLDLSYNDLKFEEGIPNSFKNFCNLRSLHLSSVELNQEINNILEILSSKCFSDGLQSLHLDDCKLSGHLTGDVSYFKDLSALSLRNNLISGPIPLSLGEMNSLAALDLSNNRLNGTLPVSFGNLTKLGYVDISKNNFEGEVSQLHFANLASLSSFAAFGMGNNITLRVSSNWTPPLQLQILDLESWNIGPQFPEWLRLLKHLTYLDLSNSGISTPIPIWFWDSFSNYGYLNFSHNQLYGSIPNIPYVSRDVPVIDLNSNNFSGVVPYFSSNVSLLDLSNNFFSGSIYNFLCSEMNEVKQMQVLILERNLLSSEIPDCWRSWEELMVIKLSNNLFSGNIPTSIGTLSLLQSLNLRNNNLFGEVPSSLENCTRLLTLDLSGNNLVGNIPQWIGDKFPSLRILRLQSNKFHGYLPKELCHLVSLHILDLAHNNFSSTIPKCFHNFTAMSTRNNSTGSFGFNSIEKFEESSPLVIKGILMEYSTILGLVRSIDLSDNDLSGEIPAEITSLAGLISLNLSQNALTGSIPIHIGDMKGLESIDFSQNQLFGEIPGSMSTLTFLSKLNLSHNKLSGRIPLGTQLQSFDSSSFMGNQLCGLPLTNNCSTVDDVQPSTEENDGNENEVDVWFYISIVFGFVVGFWSAVGSLIFNRRWRHFYFHSLYNMREKIWWNFFGRFH